MCIASGFFVSKLYHVQCINRKCLPWWNMRDILDTIKNKELSFFTLCLAGFMLLVLFMKYDRQNIKYFIPRPLSYVTAVNQSIQTSIPVTIASKNDQTLLNNKINRNKSSIGAGVVNGIKQILNFTRTKLIESTTTKGVKVTAKGELDLSISMTKNKTSHIAINSSDERTNITTAAKQGNQTFVILWYAIQPYFIAERNLTVCGCTYRNCLMTKNKELLNTSDVVLFAYRDMRQNVPQKKDGQIWVIVNIESPAYDSDLSIAWKNKFDWSMSYRQESEVFLNYKTFLRTTPLQKNYNEIYRNKTGFAAWVVSNCNSKSKREAYVSQLKQYIKVDVYGNCGKLQCPGSMPECHERLSQKYLFYLGFENSICKDYITEKVFHTFLDNSNAVYVARSAPNIKSVMPPNTYIDAYDFDSPKSLADYLTKLSADENRYISYLKEADKYHIDNERNYDRSLCDLCELLNTYQTRNITWSGRTFNEWYRKGACQN